MTNISLKNFFILLIIIIIPYTLSGELNTKLDIHTYINHQISTNILPIENFIEVKDEISIPYSQYSENFRDNKTISFKFKLHSGLKILSHSKNVSVVPIERKEKTIYSAYVLNIKSPKKKRDKLTLKFTLTYKGKINHPIKNSGEEYARAFSETPGLITKEGIYLSSSSFWYPVFKDKLVTFSIKTIMPLNWISVSQGTRIINRTDKNFNISKWDSPEPMDDIYLIAAKFQEFLLKVGKVNIIAFLRSNDDTLANKYLETTGQYLNMYQKLIAKYPFTKFALIENFWETGYGMPSFTLLGPKVIRFPFILHSSYPHELLHNWWGNSVYVDYKTGNWCEGLTVYYADHLIKEQRGQGASYRRDSLKGFTDYVNDKNDFPLSKFINRYNSSSSAIGYGKSMMLFNALRLNLGDKLFVKGIAAFYNENKFKKASFNDIRISMEKATGKKLKNIFDQFVFRKGAPILSLSNVEVKQISKKFQLSFKIKQTQKEMPYSSLIPVAIYLENNKKAKIEKIKFSQREQMFSFTFNNKPLRIEIDPEFDVFRKLDINEIPPTLSKIFGAKKVLIILPEKAPADLLKAYTELAIRWAKNKSSKVTYIKDSELNELPADKALWLFGRENKFSEIIRKNIKKYNSKLDDNYTYFSKKKFSLNEKSIVITIKNPIDPSKGIAYLSVDRADAMQGLGRKLPHYSKYSYLTFEGSEPVNIFKGQWKTVNSPLVYDFSKGAANSKSLPKRKALANLPAVFSENKLLDHIKFLSSGKLRGRGIGTNEIEIAGKYIADNFKKFGLKPLPEKTDFSQTWNIKSGPDNKKIQLKNIIGIIPGTKKEYETEAVILSAHYDHLGLGWPDVRKGNKGKIHYGADDNASGVSVLLELARSMSKMKPERAIVFIAFTAEENGLLGSKYFLSQLNKDEKSGIMAIINLDTVGRLFKKKPLVLGATSSREWKFIFMGTGYTTGIESELVDETLDSSDQASFINNGIPGIQLFSGGHFDYHRPTDTFEKIDSSGMVKIATLAKEIAVYLSSRKDPLTFTGKGKVKLNNDSKKKGTKRRARTGFMPDFSFKGIGVKIGGISSNSPAFHSGLLKGDIIISLNKKQTHNLKEYSTVLKSLNPGDSVQLVFIRDKKEHEVKITLEER